MDTEKNQQENRTSIISEATKQVAGEVTKKAASSLLKKGVETTATHAAVSATGATVGAGVGAAGGPVLAVVGAAIGFIGEKIISIAGSGARGLFSFFKFNEISKGVMGGSETTGQKKSDWMGDDGLAIALIASFIAVYVVATIWIGTRDTSFVVSKDKTSGVPQGVVQNRGESHGDPNADTDWNKEVERAKKIPREKQNPVDFCAKNPTVEWCKSSNCPTCTCPVVSSTGSTPYITQGPGGSWSHANSNAIDIGIPMQSRIRSPVIGVVTVSTNKYEDGSGFAGSSDGGGYGNHIVITTPEGNTLMVAHLAYGSMPAKGTTITVGQQIGRIGETGNSTGPHLHIGFTNKGAPNIGSLFPTNVPVPTNCASASQCGFLAACGAQP